jgi:hypothetical protein
MGMSEKRKYEGLWYNSRGWYCSKSFRKRDIEELLKGGINKRLVVRHNKYWKEGSNTPRFVFAFVDADKSQKLIEELPYVSPEEEVDILSEYDDGTEYVSIDEAITYARDGASSIRGGYDEYDVYCSGDLTGRTVTEIVNEQMAED